MTCAEYLDLIVEYLEADGDAVVDFTDVTIGGRFAKKSIRLLNAIAASTFSFYCMRQDLGPRTPAGTEKDRTVCTKMSTAGAYSVHTIDKLWIDEAEIRRCQPYELAAVIQSGSKTFSTAGVPSMWAEFKPYWITFDIPCDSASMSAITVSGWADHPTITDEDDELLLGDSEAEAYAMMTASFLKLGVSSDDISAGRVREYSSTADKLMRDIRGQNVKRWHSDGVIV